MPRTVRQISRSHVISKFPPDFLPSLHKVTQMRHTFCLKTLILSLLELPGWRLCSFLYARNLGDPLNCWKTQKPLPNWSRISRKVTQIPKFGLHRENESSFWNALYTHENQSPAQQSIGFPRRFCWQFPPCSCQRQHHPVDHIFSQYSALFSQERDSWFHVFKS